MANVKKAAKTKKRIKNTNTVGSGRRITPTVVSASGAGGVGDRGAGYQVSRNQRLSFFRELDYIQLYFTDWQAEKIVNIPIDDALRETWNYAGLEPEEENKIRFAENKLKVLTSIRQAMVLERLIGGCVIFMGVSDGAETPEAPLVLKNIGLQDLRYLNVIPRTRLTNPQININPLSENYGRPEAYIIKGELVHRSRLLVFDGSPLLPVIDGTITPFGISRKDGFGQSVLAPILQDLIYATGSRQGAFQLLNTASLWFLSGNFQTMVETEEGNQKAAFFEDILNQASIYKGAMIDNGGVGSETKVENLAASFGSVPELMEKYLQVLSAASDIPATRFLGQAPGGLNATGTSDLENYYNKIDSMRENRLKPQLMKLFSIMSRSVLGGEFSPLETDITFDSLWNTSASEEATIRNQNAGTISNLLASGAITGEEGHKMVIDLGIIKDPLAFEEMEDPGGEEIAVRERIDQLSQLRGTLDADNTTGQRQERPKANTNSAVN